MANPDPNPSQGASQSDPGDLLRESRWVERLALGLVGDASVAQDLSQDAMLVALRREPDRGQDLRPWLGSVVRRLALRWRRDRARDQQRRAGGQPGLDGGPAFSDVPGGLPSTDELAAQAELRRWVAEEVERLSEPGRTVVWLRYFQGLSAAEIARLQGVPSGTVRARLKRSLDQLRAAMDARESSNGGGTPSHWSATALTFSVPTPAAPAPPPGAAPLPLLELLLMTKSTGLAVLTLSIAAACLGLWWKSATPAAGAEQVLGPQPSEAEDSLAQLQGGPAELDPSGSNVRREGLSDLPDGEASGIAPAPEGVLLAAVEARIVDELGRGLSGAKLVQHRSKRSVDSATNGSVRLEVELEQDPQATVVRAVHPGLADRFERVVLTDGGTADLGELELRPAGSVAGRVEDQAGQPIELARVFAVAPGSALGAPEFLRSHGPTLDLPVVEVRSGPGGLFELEGIAAGAAQLWATAGGFGFTGTDPIEVRAGEVASDIVIVLEALRDESRISGRVLDPHGTALAAVYLRTSYQHAQGGESTGTRTAEDGTFSLLLRHRVPHDFEVIDAPSWRWMSVTAKQVEPGTADLVLQFEERLAHSVHVTDPTGRAVPGYGIRVKPESDRLPRPQVPTLFIATAPEDSHVATIQVPDEPFVLEVDGAGYELATAGPFTPIALPDPIEVEVRPLPAIRGVVVDADGPVADARVTLWSVVPDTMTYDVSGYRTILSGRDEGGVTTNAKGEFELFERDSMRCTLRASAPGYAAGESEPFDLVGRQGANGIELYLGPGGSIAGTVLVPAGQSPAGSIVAIHRGDGQPQTLRVGQDGDFRFDGLTPGPWQVLQAEKEFDPDLPSYAKSNMPSDGPIPWNCVVAHDEVSRIDLDLRGKEPIVLEGSLWFSGVPRDGWTVAVRKMEMGRITTHASQALGTQGGLRLEVPEAGSYTLEYTSPGGGFVLSEDPFHLQPGGEAWNVNLPVGRLMGQVDVEQATPGSKLVYFWTGNVAGHALTGQWQVQPDSLGRFELDPVPAGPGKLRRWIPGADGFGDWHDVASAEVSEGGLATLDL